MEVEISGLDEILQNLKRLNIEEDVENSALNKAGKITQEAIKREAPVDKRNPPDNNSLHKNIKVKRAKDGEVVIHSGGAYHAHIIEGGRSGGSKMALKNGKMQKVTWGPKGPNPFFTRGFEQSKNDAKQAMIDEIKGALKL